MRTLSAVAALEFPFLHTRTLFERALRNLLTVPYDEPKLPQLDFEASPAPVHCFWSGPPPNAIAQLALRSFVHHGHAVNLFTYDPQEAVAQHVPGSVAVRPAEEVLPKAIYDECLARSEVRYFSDIFRYAALYRFGGWWIETDVDSLRPLPAVERYFFCAQWAASNRGICWSETCCTRRRARHTCLPCTACRSPACAARAATTASVRSGRSC